MAMMQRSSRTAGCSGAAAVLLFGVIALPMTAGCTSSTSAAGAPPQGSDAASEPRDSGLDMVGQPEAGSPQDSNSASPEDAASEDSGGVWTADAGVQATWSDSFVDSVGVNGHLNASSEAYGTLFSSAVLELISSAGIRHWRDQFPNGSGATAFNNMNALGAAGCKLNILIPGGGDANIDYSGY